MESDKGDYVVNAGWADVFGSRVPRPTAPAQGVTAFAGTQGYATGRIPDAWGESASTCFEPSVVYVNRLSG